MTSQAALIEVRHLHKYFFRRPDLAERLASWLGSSFDAHTVKAVDAVNLAIHPGEVLGLVGESGCGKSTLGRVMAGIIEPTQGDCYFEGVASADQTPEHARAAQLAVQMVFQDPLSSLNPRKRVIDIVGEAPVVHGLIDTAQRADYVASLLQKVGLDPALMTRFPHQFSGGQRQRIGIARALAVKPRVLVCDEAVSALDVSIQAQVLNLFMDLRESLGLTYLFISHDLGVVQHISDRVAIMYLGRVVETASTEEIYQNPRHPYTQALLKEIPIIGSGKRLYSGVKGELASALKPPAGCHFHPRCPHATDRCRQEAPLLEVSASGHATACHLPSAHL